MPAVVANSPLWGDDINEWYVGGSFDLKFVKLMASYQDQDDKNRINNDNSTWSLGAVIPVGNFGIHLAYAQTDFDSGVIDGKSQRRHGCWYLRFVEAHDGLRRLRLDQRTTMTAWASVAGRRRWRSGRDQQHLPGWACVTRSNTTSAVLFLKRALRRPFFLYRVWV
jgi:predicted porin